MAVAVCVATAGCGFVNGEPGPGPATAYLIELGEELPYPDAIHAKEYQKRLIGMGWRACGALKNGASEGELLDLTDFELQPVIPAAISHFCPEEA